MMRKATILTVGALAVLLVCCPAPARAEAGMKAALTAIPADSMGFLCIPSAKDIDTKVNTVLQQLGLAQMLPTTFLGLVKEQTGVGDSLDEAGSLIMFMYEPKSTAGDDMDAASVLLLPASDTGQLMEALGCGEETDGLRPLVFWGQDHFALAKGSHVYICSSQETLKKVAKSEKDITARLDPASLKHLASQDLALWVDVQKLGKLVQPFVESFVEAAKSQASSPASIQGIQARSMERNIKMLMDGVESGQIGLTIKPQGIGLSMHMLAKAGSEIGDLVKAYPSTSKCLLVGLPADGYVLVAGELFDEAAMKKSMEDFDALFEADEVKEHCDPDQLPLVRDNFRDMLLAIRGAAFSLSALPESPEGLAAITVVLKVESAKDWIERVGKIIPAAKQLAKDDEAREMLGHLKHEPAAATLEGVPVDRVSFDVFAATEMDEEEVAQWKKIIGKDGLSALLAPATDDYVALTVGGGEARMTEALKLAKAGKAPLGDDAAIKKVAANVPETRYMEMYFAGDRLFSLVDSIYKVWQGEGLPIRMAEVNAPIAFTGSAEGLAMQMDIFLPMEMVVAIKDTVMQATGMMLGGQQPTSGEEEDDTL